MKSSSYKIRRKFVYRLIISFFIVIFGFFAFSIFSSFDQFDYTVTTFSGLVLNETLIAIKPVLFTLLPSFFLTDLFFLRSKLLKIIILAEIVLLIFIIVPPVIKNMHSWSILLSIVKEFPNQKYTRYSDAFPDQLGYESIAFSSPYKYMGDLKKAINDRIKVANSKLGSSIREGHGIEFDAIKSDQDIDNYDNYVINNNDKSILLTVDAPAFK